MEEPQEFGVGEWGCEVYEWVVAEELVHCVFDVGVEVYGKDARDAGLVYYAADGEADVADAIAVVLAPVHGDEDVVFHILQAESGDACGCVVFDLGEAEEEGIYDGVAGDEDAVGGYAFGQEVVGGELCGRVVEVGEACGEDAVDLFGEG